MAKKTTNFKEIEGSSQDSRAAKNPLNSSKPPLAKEKNMKRGSVLIEEEIQMKNSMWKDIRQKEKEELEKRLAEQD